MLKTATTNIHTWDMYNHTNTIELCQRTHRGKW